MASMFTDLFSAGAMTSDRSRLELRMERATFAAARAFVREVGDTALHRPGDFSAGYVDGRWSVVTMTLLTVQARALGLSEPRPQTPLTDDRLRATAQRLTDLPIADEAYASARAVMATEPTAKAMRAAMSLKSGESLVVAGEGQPDQPALTAALGLGTFGRSWFSTLAEAIRREATITVNMELIRRVLLQGRDPQGATAGSIVWVAHHDERTRPTHLAADGYAAKPGGLYQVGTEWLRFPGDPAGSPAETMQCRCVLAARYLADLTRRETAIRDAV